MAKIKPTGGEMPSELNESICDEWSFTKPDFMLAARFISGLEGLLLA